MASSTRLTRSSARKLMTKKADSLKSPTSEHKGCSLRNEAAVTFPKAADLQKTPTKHKASCEVEYGYISSVTPPKQTRTHATDVDSVKTPSSLFKNLSLKSPVKKPRSTNTKKSLFEACNQEEGVEKLENEAAEQLEKPKTQYQNARRALHSQTPTDMPGREKEIEDIRNFIEEHIENGTSGSIYISGPPGTGKTASLNLILEDKGISSLIQKIYINCTSIKSATSVYSRLNKELCIKVNGKSEKDNLSAFERYLKKKHKPILIVLDEIDQLETKNHSILYTIFEWPSRLDSKIILVGIANALDLTDRTLPRLQARCDLKPKLLHFAPYTKEQIVCIFTSRLKAAGVFEVFSSVAIQMLAAKNYHLHATFNA
uniref:AAA+ ATPase domain-containing protein n=1 Tax=Dendroctonus ponderosae TaxID=77166 RepID=J3JWB6_DENPD|nr:unknown [Dendroctonus ponderosae]